MSDRNWGFILVAVAGLAVYAFQVGVGVGELGNKPEAYPRYQEAADDGEGADATPSGNIHSPRYKQPCENPEGKNESDLCAQYRAAEAAGLAAYWARWQFWLSLFGVIGLGGTIFLTIRATNAAVRSNEIARENQRPWITFKGPEAAIFTNSHINGKFVTRGLMLRLSRQFRPIPCDPRYVRVPSRNN